MPWPKRISKKPCVRILILASCSDRFTKVYFENLPELVKRDVKPIGLSVDTVEDHRRWIHDIEETRNCRIEFPLLADVDHRVATPAEWSAGGEVAIVPSLKDENEIRRLFPRGYKAVKPYLRLTPQPNE